MTETRARESDRNRPVVVGVDGSAYAQAAADWAAGEAMRRDVALRMLAVVDFGTGSSPFGVAVPTSSAWDDRIDEALRLLSAAETRVTSAYPDLKVERDVMVGDPVPVLEAAGRDAAVLVVGSRGRGGIAGLNLGSVSFHLAAGAHCPLVVVPQGHAAAAHPGPTVIGANMHECLRVLRFGLEHAERAGGGLRVVHVWNPYPGHSATFVSDTDILARHAAEQLSDWLEAADAERFGPRPEIRVLRGHPAEVLIGQPADAGLIVVGAHRGWLPLTGSAGPVLHELLKHSRCPVAVVPAH